MSLRLPLPVEHLDVPVDSEITIQFSETVEGLDTDGSWTLEVANGEQWDAVPARLLPGATLPPLYSVRLTSCRMTPSTDSR